jgi:hypothetical protein
VPFIYLSLVGAPCPARKSAGEQRLPMAHDKGTFSDGGPRGEQRVGASQRSKERLRPIVMAICRPTAQISVRADSWLA